MARYKEIKDFLQHNPMLLVGESPSNTVKEIVTTKLSTMQLSEMCETVDICFCVDCTGSMEPYIEAAKETCAHLIEMVMKHTRIRDFKFAFVAYRDHPQEDEDEEREMVKALRKLLKLKHSEDYITLV